MPPLNQPAITVITMGCSKNRVDSERLLRQLQAAGCCVFHDTLPASVKTVLINTCGFIGDAKEESIETILTCLAAKQRGELAHVYVFGCLSQRYKEALEKELPEVDAFFGVTDFQKILQTVTDAALQPRLLTHRVLTTPGHYAYLKISEGCNHGCSYCAIPLIRGRHVSVPLEQLLEEAALLAAQGVKELLITAQDTTSYGIDLYRGERRLAMLLNRLADLPGVEWIRLHYTYPAHFPDDVIDLLRTHPKMCKYLDIPLQHVSDSVLRHMRRGIDGRQTRELIAKIRHAVPGIALRTTLIVGHPGETEAAFDELYQFVQDTQFERLGVFCYSEEEGTYGARYLVDMVPDEVKQERHARLMHLQANISQAWNHARSGTVCRVMIDRVDDDRYVGRTEYDSPEVDGEVFIPRTPEALLAPGDFCRVQITGADTYDLFATLLPE